MASRMQRWPHHGVPDAQQPDHIAVVGVVAVRSAGGVGAHTLLARVGADGLRSGCANKPSCRSDMPCSSQNKRCPSDAFSPWRSTSAPLALLR